MKTGKEERRPCANEGCDRPAETDSRFCETCGLDWELLRRDLRTFQNVGAGLAPARAPKRI